MKRLDPELLRGVPLRELAAYSSARASHIVRVPSSTLRRWASGGGAHKALFQPADTRPLMLSFDNLVEAFVLASMRCVHHISMQKVHACLATVGRKLEHDRPGHCSTRASAPTGVRLFVEEAGRILEISRDLQALLRTTLGDTLQRIEWERGLAAGIYPWLNAGRDPSQPRTIMVDPRFGFGQPVIVGTGIPTNAIASRHRAGESIADLARDYRVHPALIEDAIRVESREAGDGA